MRLLIVTTANFTDRTRYFPEVVLARSLVKAGWRVSACVLASDCATGMEVVDGVRVVRVRRRPVAAWHLARWIPRADLVHIFHVRNPLGPIAAVLSRFLRRPLIFSEAGLLHDPYLVRQGEYDPLASPVIADGLRNGWRSRLYHLPLTAADRVVFLSEHNVRIAEQIGLDRGRATWLPHVVDGQRFQHHANAPSAHLVRGEGFGLFVGQMKRRKGWDVLLRAVALVPPDVLRRFVFVSNSVRQPPPEFSELVDRLGVGPRVSYQGKVTNEALEQLFRTCEVVLVPSRYEGFGLVPLEGFEAAKPVVASDVPALNEYLKHDVNSHLVPPDNPKALALAICRIVEDPRLRDRIVEGGHRTLAEFDVRRWLGSWMSMYESVRKAAW